jgi:hypothetical protein
LSTVADDVSMQGDRWTNRLFVLVLATSTLRLARAVPRAVSLLLITAALGAFVALVLVRGVPALATPRYVWVTLATVWTTYLVGVPIHSGGLGALPGVLVFVSVSAVVFLLVPRVVNREYALGATSRLGAVIVLVGLPALFVGPYSVGPLEVGLWPRHATVVPALGPLVAEPVRVRPLISYFRNPNLLSPFLLMGALAALAEVRRGRRIGWLLLAVNTAGLWLAHTRSTILAAAVGAGLYAVHAHGGRRALVAVVASGGVFGTGALAVVAGVLPGPDALASLNLSGRRTLWRASVEAILQRPLLGYGQVPASPILDGFLPPGMEANVPHNSYLRVAFQTGVVGGLAYLGLVGWTLLARLRAAQRSEPDVLFALAASMALVMVFQNFVLFGQNPSNLVASLTFAYAADGLVAVPGRTERHSRAASSGAVTESD